MTKTGNFEREHTTYLISQNKICISQGPEGTSKRSEVFLDNFTKPEASYARTFLTASDHYSTVIMMMMKMMRLTMMVTMKITLILLVTVKTIMIYKTMLLNRNLRREGKLIALKSM